MDELERIRQRYAERDAAGSLTGFWSLRNPVALHLAQERERAVLRLLSEAGVELTGRRLLDIGCGLGVEFASYLRWGAEAGQLFGVDLLHARLRAARGRSNALLAQASAARLPFAGAAFDLVCLNVVLSSIVDDQLRREAGREALRVLRPGGLVLWYDIARARGCDAHLRPVPRAEVEGLLPGLQWRWQRLSTDLGVLRRLHALLGERAMRAFDLSGLFKTHLLGLGGKAA